MDGATVLMVAQTVPTSAQYIDKLTTVGTGSASGEKEATGTSDCSPCLHESIMNKRQIMWLTHICCMKAVVLICDF